jgi:hypothetical protein
MFLNEYAGILNGPPGLNAAANDTETAVKNLYRSILKRDARSGEIEYWVRTLGPTISDSGVALVTNGIYPESVNPQQLKQVRDYIIGTFETKAQRTPTAAEVDYWLNLFGPSTEPDETALLDSAIANEIAQRKTDYASIARQNEAAAKAAADREMLIKQQSFLDQAYIAQQQAAAAAAQAAAAQAASLNYDTAATIANTYATILKRQARDTEIDYWVNVFGPTMNADQQTQVQNLLLQEVQNLPQIAQTAQIVVDLYRTVLKRDPTQNEVNYWVNVWGTSVEQVEIDQFMAQVQSEIDRNAAATDAASRAAQAAAAAQAIAEKASFNAQQDALRDEALHAQAVATQAAAKQAAIVSEANAKAAAQAAAIAAQKVKDAATKMAADAAAKAAADAAAKAAADAAAAAAAKAAADEAAATAASSKAKTGMTGNLTPLLLIAGAAFILGKL